MDRIIKVRGLIAYHDKLLLVRLKPYKKKLQKDTDFWCLPGGTLEDNESLMQCIEREMIEETGVPPTVGRLLYVQQFSSDGRQYLEFIFNITNARDYLKIDLHKTTHGIKEISEIGFIDPKSVRVLPDFLAQESSVEILQSNAPTRVHDYL